MLNTKIAKTEKLGDVLHGVIHEEKGKAGGSGKLEPSRGAFTSGRAMRHRGGSPIRAVLVPLVLLVGCSRFASEKRIALRFTPKENVTANVPATEGLIASRSVEVLPLIDARGLSDRTLVGENREHTTAVPIRATSSVEEFATLVLKKCLAEWGVRLGTGDLVLHGEITNLLVTEDQTYSTAVSIRFRLEDRSRNAFGKAL
jgi:hypothetical protein